MDCFCFQWSVKIPAPFSPIILLWRYDRLPSRNLSWNLPNILNLKQRSSVDHLILLQYIIILIFLIPFRIPHEYFIMNIFTNFNTESLKRLDFLFWILWLNLCMTRLVSLQLSQLLPLNTNCKYLIKHQTTILPVTTL